MIPTANHNLQKCAKGWRHCSENACIILTEFYWLRTMSDADWRMSFTPACCLQDADKLQAACDLLDLTLKVGPSLACRQLHAHGLPVTFNARR